MTTLCLITAAHRSEPGLRRFHADLAPLLGANFHWIIKDSGVCPATRAWARELSSPYIRFISGLDEGIYPALNEALRMVDSVFYLVAGLDDVINPVAVREVLLWLEGPSSEQVDIAAFPVRVGQRVLHRKRWRPVALSVSGLVSSHSVGTVIRRTLHDRFGYYDESYRILADSHFIKRAYLGGARFRYFRSPVMGEFATTGVSNTQHARILLETYDYNVATGSSVGLQALWLAVRTLLMRVTRFT